MCLIGLALDAHPRFALVIAANRDEFFARPARALDWWRNAPDAPWLLAGRDLSAGGTWMGLSERGRIGMLTNVRDPARYRTDAPSRGALVPAWLDSDSSIDALWPRLAAQGCNPFNLIGGDLATGRWWWADDRAAQPRALDAGVHGLSNASLDTPWPKVQRLTLSLQQALDTTDDADTLTSTLFAALADRTPADDDALPDTGVGLARERMLSSAFIHSAERGYGTRCSTVLVGERVGDGWQLRLSERRFDADGVPVEQSQVRLDAWPRASARTPVRRVALSAAAAPSPGARFPLR